MAARRARQGWPDLLTGASVTSDRELLLSPETRPGVKTPDRYAVELCARPPPRQEPYNIRMRQVNRPRPGVSATPGSAQAAPGRLAACTMRMAQAHGGSADACHTRTPV